MTAAAFAAAALTGGLAAVLRYALIRAIGATAFPWAVLLVNATGSALGGAVLGLVHAGALPTEWELIVFGGLAGGLTTFSTLAVDTVQLARGGRRWLAVGNVAGSFLLGIAAACAGWAAVMLLS